jgi:ABC-type enterochelin transport system ATPase subunit
LRRQLYSEREAISLIREGIASNITRGSIEDAESGTPPMIQVRIIRRGDRSHFKALLQGALQGSKLRYGQMVDSFSASCLPGEFADLIRQKHSQRLAQTADIDAARADSLIQHLNDQPEFLYELDSLWLDDRVEIRLNVADTDSALPEYKEAAELSTGQKCTAVLPIILMAESSGPLLIDQPENNLDNHYIFTDVVPRLEAIKGNRQLIFITHNPNIPVLADAERVAVLRTEAGEDGVKGKLKSVGTIEEVREEIISLLEGGREAFQLRAQKYATR